METSIVEKNLRNEIVHRLMKVGCSDAADLANEIAVEASPSEIRSTLDALAKEGVVRRVNDSAGKREFEGAFAVFELVK